MWGAQNLGRFAFGTVGKCILANLSKMQQRASPRQPSAQAFHFTGFYVGYAKKRAIYPVKSMASGGQ